MIATRNPSRAPPGGGPPDGRIEQRVHSGIGWVTLARPDKKNAVTCAMWSALPEVLGELSAREDVTAVALRGSGGTFGAGADLRDVLAATAGCEEATTYCSLVVRALLAVAKCRVPTVALVDGVATGGGAELALAADVRLSEGSAMFSFPFARLGIVPDRFTLRRLSTLVGQRTARRLVVTGDVVDGLAALSLGLVDTVVPAGDLEASAIAWASGLGGGSTRAARVMREMLLEDEIRDAPGDDVTALIGPMVASMIGGDVRAAALRFLGSSRGKAKP